MITSCLLLAIGVPMAAASALAVLPVRAERTVALVAELAAATSAAASLCAVGAWAMGSAHALHTAPRTIFDHDGYHLALALLLDGTAVTFLVLVQFVTVTVVRFSRFYLHREPGFARFFATVLFFQGAMSLLATAGDLVTLLVGWELVGVASFLLIAFYRERRSAIRAALKAYSVYRVADLGLLLAAGLADVAGARELGLLLLFAAMGKSAQFPFSFWLPRAMEGPTPSSALFYGGLSVHAGAYLLLRTADVWEGDPVVCAAVGGVGALTAVTASLFGRVQPTIKGQIGYASVATVGLMFVEMALGLHTLALVHLVSNAVLRCYQLLVSPSAVAYVLRLRASGAAPRPTDGPLGVLRWVPDRVRSTLYVFALQEGFEKDTLKRLAWAPLRWLGTTASSGPARGLPLGLAAVGVALTPWRGSAAAWVLLAAAVACGARSLVAWDSPRRAVAWIGASSVSVATAAFAVGRAHVGFASELDIAVVVASCLLVVAATTAAVPSGSRLPRFGGLSHQHPVAAAVALVGTLGIAGFPLTPAFVGEDLLLHEILHTNQTVAFAMAAVLALDGYLAMRLFALTFFGPRPADLTRAGG